jgi:hypothetical protein
MLTTCLNQVGMAAKNIKEGHETSKGEERRNKEVTH